MNPRADGCTRRVARADLAGAKSPMQAADGRAHVPVPGMAVGQHPQGTMAVAPHIIASACTANTVEAGAMGEAMLTGAVVDDHIPQPVDLPDGASTALRPTGEMHSLGTRATTVSRDHTVILE